MSVLPSPPPSLRERRPRHAGDWRHEAACQHVDPDLFFPIGAGPAAAAREREAKQVCNLCPVRQSCLQWAISTNVDGVWGGTSEQERRSLSRRARTRPAMAAPVDSL